MTWTVTGRRTPTDFSVFTDQPDQPYSDADTSVECQTREQAEALALWYADAKIVETR